MTESALPGRREALRGPRPLGIEDAAASPSRARALTLQHNELVGPKIHVLTFGLGPAEEFEFRPGQYVTFRLQRDGKSLPRSYSIYSSPHRRDRISLLIKEVPGGFASPYLCGLSPDSHPTLTALAPLGRFVLHDPGDRTVVLVATGVGLAPFLPMLERIREYAPATPTWLVYGNRYLEEVVDRPALERLSLSWPSFHFLPVLSRPPSDGSWPGAVGHVEEAVARQFPDLSCADVYLCGATAMVNEMQALALSLHAPKERVFVDRWGEHGA
jgi:CDP-4-dehydro-6-deoxyglucose reductase, E3